MLLFQDKIPVNQEAFAAKVISISKSLGINPDWLMICMITECGLDSTAMNSIGAGGLIGFMPDTAKSLGTTVTDLVNMSNVDQLDYVYKYFAPYAGKYASGICLKIIDFFPAAILNWNNDKYVFEGYGFTAQQLAQANQPLDVNKDGLITMADFKQYYYNFLKGYNISQEVIDDFMTGAVTNAAKKKD